MPEQLAALGLLPVIVIDDPAQARPLAQALLDSAEVTFRPPHALEALAVLADYPELIGWSTGDRRTFDTVPGRPVRADRRCRIEQPRRLPPTALRVLRRRKLDGAE